MVAVLRETLKESEYDIAYTYLCASWQAESSPDVYARCLQKCLVHLNRALNRMDRQDAGWASTQLLKGEVLRRLSRLDEAEAHFRALAKERPKGPIQVFLAPEEVMAALQEICEAPFVRELAKDPALPGRRLKRQLAFVALRSKQP